MHFPTTALLTALATLAAAAPAPAAPLDARQGGFFVAVGTKYSGGGCNPNEVIFGDPIFGDGNVCQPLARNPGVPILSYNTTSVSAGCSVALYTTSDCTGTKFLAPVGGCVTAGSAFVSTFVTCV